VTRKILCLWLLGGCCISASAADVGDAISMGQPDYYGQIDMGHFPPPKVIFSQPVIIVHSPQYASAPPIYLHIPPGYERHWHRHCAQYNACNRPVYFVREEWYINEYVPNYRPR
jgi:hypothetical protein